MKLQYKQILLAPRYGITKLVEDDVYLISGGGGVGGVGGGGSF